MGVFVYGSQTVHAETTTPTITKVSLPVPFYWEIPDGVWVKPWNGACEEAAVSAVEGFYLGYKKQIVPRLAAKAAMWPLFGIEDKWLGHNSDTDAKDTAWLINNYTSFDADIVDNPTLEQIKAELRARRPVISFHYGYDLNNPLHRFRRGGSSYHVMAIVGFDDATGEFLMNDSELKDGIDFRYKYATILSTLHDFNYKKKTATGPARVLFTQPKTIVKAVGSNRIYLVHDGVKRHITAPVVFKNHRWSWGLVKTIDKATLDAMETGVSINI